MKPFKFFIYLILGLFLVLFDVAFFSTFEIFGATLISSFLVLVIMAMTDKRRDFIYFALLLVIYLACFSSLPLPLIALDIIFLPLIINLFRKKFFPEPNTFTAGFYFLITSFLFQLSFLAWAGEWNYSGFLSVLSFTLLNTVFGLLFFLIYSKIRKKLLADFEIKI